jgi:hypothetical protein
VSQSRGEPSKLNLRTLTIASCASAAAAIVIHQVWRPGVLLGAAVTPLIVALVTEALNKPAQRLEALRTEGPRRRRRGGPQPDPDPRPQPDPAAPGGEPTDEYSSVQVYGRPEPSGARRGLLWALAIAVAAFLIAAIALSVTELVFGGSVSGGGTRTTYFGGGGSETPTPTPTETPAGDESPTPTPTEDPDATPTPEVTETPAETPTPDPADTPTPAPTPTTEAAPTPAPTPAP